MGQNQPALRVVDPAETVLHGFVPPTLLEEVYIVAEEWTANTRAEPLLHATRWSWTALRSGWTAMIDTTTAATRGAAHVAVGAAATTIGRVGQAARIPRGPTNRAAATRPCRI